MKILSGEILKKPIQTSVQIAHDIHIDIGEFVNHSCIPNVRVEHGVFVAKEHISPGEKVTLDYTKSKIYSPIRCEDCGIIIRKPMECPFSLL